MEVALKRMYYLCQYAFVVCFTQIITRNKIMGRLPPHPTSSMRKLRLEDINIISAQGCSITKAELDDVWGPRSILVPFLLSSTGSHG